MRQATTMVPVIRSSMTPEDIPPAGRRLAWPDFEAKIA